MSMTASMSVKDLLQLLGVDAVQHVADLLVGRQLLDTEHGAGVVDATALLHQALEGQERWALTETICASWESP